MALKFWGPLVVFGFVVVAVIWLPTTLSDSDDETSAPNFVGVETIPQDRPVVVAAPEPQPEKEPISLSVMTPVPAPTPPPITPARRNLNLVFEDRVTDPLEARQFVSEALLGGEILGEEYEEAGRRLRELNRTPEASLLPALETWSYTVRAGDSLWHLCNSTFPKLFDTKRLEAGLVKMVNGMANDVIHPGQVLRIPKGSLELVVNKSKHGLTAYLGSVAVGAYRVGLGKEGQGTPVGEFTVEERQEDPPWHRDGQRIPFGDPANELGTRWLGFYVTDTNGRTKKTSYGIHGTWQPETIGKSASKGCIRMRNEEVEELFPLVARGTVVTVGE